MLCRVGWVELGTGFIGMNLCVFVVVLFIVGWIGRLAGRCRIQITCAINTTKHRRSKFMSTCLTIFTTVLCLQQGGLLQAPLRPLSPNVEDKRIF